MSLKHYSWNKKGSKLSLSKVYGYWFMGWFDQSL